MRLYFIICAADWLILHRKKWMIWKIMCWKWVSVGKKRGRILLQEERMR